MHTDSPIRKTIGLALGSGGARGLAHIGVIKTLVRHGIPIDFIAGSSAGALIGGMFAALMDTAPLENIVRSFRYRDMISLMTAIRFSSGVLSGSKAKQFITDHIGERTVEDLAIPFAAVASDVRTADIVTIRSGNLADAIWASCTVPLLFEPTVHEGRYLVDGGLTLPVPVPVAREMGADIVIGVNLDSNFFATDGETTPSKCPSTLSVSVSSLNLTRHHLARLNSKDADIVVAPDVPLTDFRQFVHGEEFVLKGEQAMESSIPLLKRLLGEDGREGNVYARKEYATS